MSAASEARKQFKKEQELEKLRVKKAAQEAKLAAMTPDEREKAKKSSRRAGIGCLGVLVIIIAIIAIAVAGGSKKTPAVATSTSTAIVADAGAELGCDHFRNVMGDISKGLLTDAEIRTKLQQIYSDAQVSTNTGIASNAQAMLAADTSGDSTALKNAIIAFGAACAAVGH